MHIWSFWALDISRSFDKEKQLKSYFISALSSSQNLSCESILDKESRITVTEQRIYETKDLLQYYWKL